MEDAFRDGRFDWGVDGPPPEAYSRVTHAERFAPLHDEARRIVAELAASYDVEVARIDGADLAPPPRADHPRDVEAHDLLPSDPGASSMRIRLTDFPGVVVEHGWWQRMPFPNCGCDACGDHVDDVIEELRDWIEIVVAGHVEERSDGAWWSSRYRGSSGRSGSGRTRVGAHDFVRARAPATTERAAVSWAPWPRRTSVPPNAAAE